MQHNQRPPFDRVITDIVEYVDCFAIDSAHARATAHLALADSLSCAFEALSYPECTKLLGPCVPGTIVPNGARVCGTAYVLDPVDAAFGLSALIRWLDYNDAFWGTMLVHPSDAWGALLMVGDWASRTRRARGDAPLLMRELIDYGIKAYEIMGALVARNAFTADMGLDHALLVKIASAAVVTAMLGGTREEIMNALSNAWIDGHSLSTFRRKPNAGSRKSWAAADAAARGVWLALVSIRGEMGYPSALTAPTWGFYHVHAKGKPLELAQPYGTHVMENVQFKLAYPAAFHAQTAAEAAIRMHAQVRDRIADIETIDVRSHAYGLGMLDRTGPLANAADRDHCLQYVIAIGLIFGRLTAEDYEDDVAADPRIDALRAKMRVSEDPAYTRDFSTFGKRANPNSISVRFRDGSTAAPVEVAFPVGHPDRRAEGLPLLVQKFERNVARVFPHKRAAQINRLFGDSQQLAAMAVDDFAATLAL